MTARQLRNLKDKMYGDCYGFSEPWSGNYGINVEGLWNRSLRRCFKKSEEAAFKLFARDFALTTGHEFIHIEIYKSMPKKYKYYHRETNKFLKKEEKIIFYMLEERWLKKYDIFYDKHFPYKKKEERKKKEDVKMPDRDGKGPRTRSPRDSKPKGGRGKGSCKEVRT